MGKKKPSNLFGDVDPSLFDEIENPESKFKSDIKKHPIAGEKHYLCKLTEEKVREIRRLHAKGVKLTSLKSKFGVSLGSICDICYRRNWKHVE